MNVYVPDYLPAFRCMTSACRHTCCAGWEIDIDAESLARYERLPGDFGERVRRGISRDGAEGTPHFLLTSDERCPLLRPDGLCELILREGEDALCQICRDHPRFRSFYSCRVEMGLGLVCEEAARLILTSPHPLRLIPLPGTILEPETPTEDERYLFALREAWIASLPLQGPEARLMETLILRHLGEAVSDGRLDERIDFIHRAFDAITGGWKDGQIATLAERARVFSDMVEYDDERLEAWVAGESTEDVIERLARIP